MKLSDIIKDWENGWRGTVKNKITNVTASFTSSVISAIPDGLLDATADYREIEQEVVFASAIVAFHGGRGIKCEIDGKIYRYLPSYRSGIDVLGDYLQSNNLEGKTWACVTTKEIISGIWYIL